ncbi:MAG: hypothetical protein K9H25_05815 [Rhodospirillum sp.]|nr:hypothetical protein [Rhodospirillum sp.]MCF8490238.1 hypothetical protein [Rhodospirillum sp.]MCF8503188.1 hypothetical protein [Rhodospirillum sp.]
MRAISMSLEEDFSYAEGGVAGLRLMGGDIFPGTPVDVVIRRATNTDPFLGPRGWQSSEFRWRSGNSRAEGTDVIVPLGPLVGSWLEDYTPLEFDLPGLDLQGSAVWSDISPPGSDVQSKGRTMGPDGGDSFGDASAPPPLPPHPTQQAPTVSVTPPEPETAPLDLKAAREAPDDILANRAASDGTTPVTGSPSPEPPKPGFPWWLVAVLVVLLLAGAGAAYSLLVMDEGTTVTVQPDSPPVVGEAAPLPTQDERLTAAVAAVDRGQPDDAIQALRALDAENHGPTLLYLARAYDSMDFQPGLASKPNDIEALKLYARACEANAAGAQESLRTLEAALRERVNQGDRITGETLRLAYPPAATACGL